MPDYSAAARRWIEPLLALRAGGAVAIRFLAPDTDPNADLGILTPGPDTYSDFAAPASFVREFSAEEIATFAGQFRQGAREVILSDAFARSVAAAQGSDTPRQMFEAAAGLLIGGQICRIRSIRPLEDAGAAYGWRLQCDAPLEAA